MSFAHTPKLRPVPRPNDDMCFEIWTTHRVNMSFIDNKNEERKRKQNKKAQN